MPDTVGFQLLVPSIRSNRADNGIAHLLGLTQIHAAQQSSNMEINGGILRLCGSNEDTDELFRGLPAQQYAEADVEIDPPGVDCRVEAGI